MLDECRGVPAEQVSYCVSQSSVSQSSHRADKWRLTPLVEDKEGIHVCLFLVRDELQQRHTIHNTAYMMLSVYVQLLQAGRTEQVV